VISLVLAYLFSKRGQKNFPVAIPFPFDQHALTELIYVYFVTSKFHDGDIAGYFRSLRKKFGDVFYLGPLFSQPYNCPTLCVSCPEVQASLVRKEKDLQWLVSLPETVHQIHGEKNFQTFPTGPEHAALRKVYSSILSPKSLEKFTTVIIQYFTELWNDLESKGEETMILEEIRKTQLRLMCKIFFDIGGDSDEERKVLEQFCDDFALTEKALFAMGGVNSKEFKDGLEARKRISKVLNDKFDSIFDSRIAESDEIVNSKTKNDYSIGSAMHQIVDSLIRLGCKSKDDDDFGQTSYKAARENLYLLLEASHGTTMFLTTSMMYLLNRSDNYEALRRVREEASVLEPTYESLKKFSFGEACVNETTRMAPIIGSVTYFIPEGKAFKIRGKDIERPVALNFNSSNWYKDDDVFENAKSFLPERWLPGEKEVSKFARSIYRPFGFGRHLCLGFPLAKLVMNTNLYCFARNGDRSIKFDEDKVKLEPGLFPAYKVCDGFIGKVIAK